MKKAKSVTKNNDLLAQLEKQKKLVAQQEENGNFNTYDHTKLARLKAAVSTQEKNKVGEK